MPRAGREIGATSANPRIRKSPNRAPYYGSEMELQASYIFEQWGKILTAAGSGLDQALKSQAHETDPDHPPRHRSRPFPAPSATS